MSAKRDERAERHPWRENVELSVMALVLALAFKAFVFEISRIPSGSMQPTLMGDGGVYDRLAVDKLSYRFRDPLRWEVVVFRHPLERSMDMVKRLVGMPGEELEIRGGDVWVRPDGGDAWRIPERSRAVQQETWKRVPSGPASWTSKQGAWSASASELVARQPGRALFRDGEPIRDEYLDGYPEAVRDALGTRSRGGKNLVGDLRLSCEVRVEASCAELALVLTEGRRVYRFTLPGPAGAESTGTGAIELVTPEPANGGAPHRVEAAGGAPRLRAGRWTRVAAQNLDDRLSLEIDGEIVAELDITPAANSSATLALEVAGGGATFGELTVSRDIFYVSEDVHTSSVAIPAGYYLMLGDNTQDSADSRDWRSTSFEWPGPDGYSESVEGNDRPGESPRRVNGPGRRALVFFKDTFGEPHFLDTDVAAQSQPVPAPLVPRHLIRGRGFAVFWPLNPAKGIYRLSWIH
jgi:signal peptidase I